MSCFFIWFQWFVFLVFFSPSQSTWWKSYWTGFIASSKSPQQNNPPPPHTYAVFSNWVNNSWTVPARAAQDSAYCVHSVCYVSSNWCDSCRICDANYSLCYAQWTMLRYFSRYLFFLYSYLGKRYSVCNIRIFWTVSILFVYFTFIFCVYLSYSIKQSSPNYILIFYSFFFFWFAVFMVVFSILMGFHIISLSYSSILLICHNNCIFFMLPLQYFPVLCVIFHSNIISMRTKNPRNIISWKKDISIPEWNATLS